MKLIKTPIDLKLLLTAIILLLSIIIIADNLYDWRDFRYEQLQKDSQALYQQTDNLAKNLAAINNMTRDAALIKQINAVLQVNGFPQYMRTIPDTTKKVTGDGQ